MSCKRTGVLHMETFYEIDYDASPIPGVGKFVIKPEKLREPIKDPVRELFDKMRDIAREGGAFRSAKYLGNNMDRFSARVFYRQGMLMKDFSDDYTGNVPFVHEKPMYQQMGYEQLRSYFTWRTKVRMGEVAETYDAYLFLYVYELLCNIGVYGPQDGLDKLMFIWKEYCVHDNILDDFVPGWIHDYFIYYNLPYTFNEFVIKHDLTGYFDELDPDNVDFIRYTAASMYDIKKSTFFKSEHRDLIINCFNYLLDKLRSVCADYDLDFDEYCFKISKTVFKWQPFENAVFYDWMNQVGKRVLKSRTVYICKETGWFRGWYAGNGPARFVLQYVFRQMEKVLRGEVGYRVSKSFDVYEEYLHNKEVVILLKDNGVSIEELITSTTREFFREATKTVVEVDAASLLQIRREALEIQEKLIVDEEEALALVPDASIFDEQSKREVLVASDESIKEVDCSAVLDMTRDRHKFTETEIVAMSAILEGTSDFKQIAAKYGIMPEVLADGINEKAMDLIGDSLLDEEFSIYEDYKDIIKELI